MDPTVALSENVVAQVTFSKSLAWWWAQQKDKAQHLQPG